MDPLQWMGAVRMRGQTADKYIIIIHMTQPINYRLVKWKASCLEEEQMYQGGVLT